MALRAKRIPVCSLALRTSPPVLRGESLAVPQSTALPRKKAPGGATAKPTYARNENPISHPMNRRATYPRPVQARLLETAMVVITGTDPDGDPIARPTEWDNAAGPAPIIFMAAEPRGHAALAPGERVLARLKP